MSGRDVSWVGFPPIVASPSGLSGRMRWRQRPWPRSQGWRRGAIGRSPGGSGPHRPCRHQGRRLQDPGARLPRAGRAHPDHGRGRRGGVRGPLPGGRPGHPREPSSSGSTPIATASRRRGPRRRSTGGSRPRAGAGGLETPRGAGREPARGPRGAVTPGDGASPGRWAEAARVARAIAEQNLRRAEVRPAAAGVINTRTVDTGQFVQDRRPARHPRRHGPPAPALQGVRTRSRCPPRRGGGHLPRVRPRHPRLQGTHLPRRPGRRPRVPPGRGARLGPQPGGPQARLLRRGQPARGVEERGPRRARGAVLASEQGFIAYVVDGEAVHERPIQLGLRTGDGFVEILDGLTPGETVVVEGSDRLADGSPVRSRNRDAPGGQGTP